MNKRHTTLLLFVVLMLMGVGVTQAQVIMPPVPCCGGGVFTDPDWLKVDYHRVNVTIENQIATTEVDMQFRNEGERLAEGTFIFPLPQGAAVDQLTMWVDGQAIDAKILRAGEARGIYNEIVRQYRDPALLEYIGSDMIQANIFPIPPGDTRRIQIRYGQALTVDNGLINYTYPMKTTGDRLVREMSISVSVSGSDPISNIYSPSHPIAINRARNDDTSFTAGFEASNYRADSDFSLFYGIATDTINVNLLTYRESANEDGFFMLMVQPPVEVDADAVIPKDVIVVVDQSGSMDGEKWDQARDAAAQVLKHLNPRDRFNMILFSTGWRLFSNSMQNPDQAQAAIDWIRGQDAAGGTDINGALLSAFDMVGERPTTILFLTDGLATEGETETSRILDNLKESAPPNVSVFTFGVGYDVDTFLLDAIVRDHHGTGTYVRPGERIDEKVASLYNKVSAPVLNDIALDFGDNMTVDWVYPTELPDLFAGEQLTLVGRYRGSADNVSIRLSGSVGSQDMSFVYNGNDFPANAGGQTFIARLWATRRIGDLLNTIRLNGENSELVDSVVNLSVRYGIITPYTSFLIEENDILTQEGRDRVTAGFAEEAEALSTQNTGAGAVAAADASMRLQSAQSLAAAPTASAVPTNAMPGDADGTLHNNEPGVAPAVNPVQSVGDKTFLLQDGIWTDTTFQPDTMQTEKIEFLSDAYFDLLAQHPELGEYFALGEQVIVVLDGTAYEVVSA